MLTDEVAKGAFREDLYFRLNVVTLSIPTLRERSKDIGILAEHFIKKYAKANEVKALPLSEAAETKLMAHSWPGNVRELENAMHRTVLLASGVEIGPEAILLTGTPGAPSSATAMGGAAGTDDGELASFTGRTVADVERSLIIDTLHHCLGNRTHAANILGISIRTLRNKLKLYHERGYAVPVPGEGERPAV